MRRGSVVFPLLLIAVGVVLLLNNLGHLPWGVWATIGRLWPVILIALGLNILVGRSVLRWALGVVLIVVIVLALLLAVVGPRPIGPAEDVRVPIGGAAQAEVALRAGVGRVVVRAGTDPNLLVGGRVVAPWPDRATWTTDRSAGVERFAITVDRRHGLPPAWWPERAQATIKLAPGISIALWATLGEGTASLDLSDLDLTALTVRGGGGRVELTLPARGRFDAEVTSAAGEVMVRIPSGLGARIRVEEAWGPVDAPTEWAREAGLILSPGYETAPHRVDLTLRAAPGRIRILSFGML